MRWILVFLFACQNGAPALMDTADPPPSDPAVSACAGVPEAACGELPDCAPVMGTPCGSTLQFAGCATAPGGVLTCSDAESGGSSPDLPGECWLFPNTCLPDGWSGCSEACT